MKKQEEICMITFPGPKMMVLYQNQDRPQCYMEKIPSLSISVSLSNSHVIYGHVPRKPTNNITRVYLRWTPEGKRKQSRPKTTWRRTVESEMKEMGQTWNELDKKAKDREQWRKLHVVLALCASGHNKD